LYRTEGASRSW
jgi:transposase